MGQTMHGRSAAAAGGLADGRGSVGSFRPSLSRAWGLAAVLLPVAVVSASPLSAVDLAYQIRAGRLMLDTHSLIRTDTFMFLSFGHAWLDQQWGAQIVLASVFRSGGWLALASLRMALAGAILSFVFLACRGKGASAWRAAWLTFAAAALVIGGLQLRPQLLGMFLFAATFWLVTTREVHPARLWCVPVLTAAWANLHGSFFLALGVLGLALVEDLRSRSPIATRTLRVAVVSAAATGFTPFGFRVWVYVWQISTDPLLRRVVIEWHPPTFGTYSGGMFLLSIAVVAGLLLTTPRTTIRWTALLTLAAFAAIGLASLRGVFWWGMVAPVVIAGLPPRSSRRFPDPQMKVNAVAVGMLGVFCVVVLAQWLPYSGAGAPSERRLTYAPPGITATLSRLLEPGDRIFNAQRWGSWFELALPENPVVVDSRFELLAQDQWDLFRNVSEGASGWQTALADWDVKVAVLAPDEQADLIPKMRTDPGWRLVYEDSDGLVFVRR